MRFLTESQKEDGLRRWCALGAAHAFLSTGLMIHLLIDELKAGSAFGSTGLALILFCGILSHTGTWFYVTRLRRSLIIEVPILELFSFHLLLTAFIGFMIYKGTWLLLYA